MKILPLQFEGKGEVKGVTFTQNRRQGNIVIMERSDGYYEVCTITSQKEATRTIGGATVHFEAKELYPSGDSWNGKCVKELDRAIRYFNKLTGKTN